MAADTKQLRESLIRSLQNEPLLVEAEMALHSSKPSEVSTQVRKTVATSLKTAPPLATVHLEEFGSLDRDLIDQFRTAMQSAVQSEAKLSEAERELLSSLDLEKLGEFRSTIDTHLESDPEISREDLAIYVPSGLGISESFRRSLESLPGEIEASEETQEFSDLVQPDRSTEPFAPGAFVAPRMFSEEVSEAEPRNYAPGAYVESMTSETPEPVEAPLASPAYEPERAPEPVKAEELRHGADEPTAHDPDRAEVALVAASLRAGLDSNASHSAPSTESGAAEATTLVPGLAAVPTLTAALEAIGSAADDFGFLVRYGRYAPDGRQSQFLVGGLGLSDLSKRLTAWLETHASLQDQVQVVDEGSGELTIYLVPAEV